VDAPKAPPDEGFAAPGKQEPTPPFASPFLAIPSGYGAISESLPERP